MQLRWLCPDLGSLSFKSFPRTICIRSNWWWWPVLVLLALSGVLAVSARAQSVDVPPVSGPVCEPMPGMPCPGNSASRGNSSDGSSANGTDPISGWATRIQSAIQKHREKKAKQDAKKKAAADAKQRAEEETERKKNAEEARIASAAERLSLAQQREAADAEQQRILADEAQRLKATFNEMKPEVDDDLKGVDDGPAAAPLVSLGGGSDLKGVDDASPAPAPAWEKTITDPIVARYAKPLASVVPPLPIPPKEVSLTWKQIYLNDDRLMNTADTVIAAWEMTGVLGESIAIPCKALMIGGKAFIAGEDGAYMYLVKKDADYDAAMAYLKNRAQAQQFAQLVQDMRQNKPLPAGSDPAMVRAARTITDPGQNSTATLVWDAMTSREALGAMVRKAAVETSTAMLSPSTEGLLQDEAERKAMFDAIRLERTQARKMMADAATTAAQREQLKTVIAQADKLSADLYKVDKLNHAASDIVDDKISDNWGAASDAVADHFWGPEAKGREY